MYRNYCAFFWKPYCSMVTSLY